MKLVHGRAAARKQIGKKTDAETIRKLRLGDVRRLLRSRWGHTLPDDDAGREDLQELLRPISVGPNAEIKMVTAVEIHAPWMNQSDGAQLIEQMNRTPIWERKSSARELGQRQRVGNSERERLKLWTIAPFDMTAEEIADQRKARRAARMRLYRLKKKRKTGQRTRQEYLASFANSLVRTKPWKAHGMSKAGWYRVRQGSVPSNTSTMRYTTQSHNKRNHTKEAVRYGNSSITPSTTDSQNEARVTKAHSHYRD